MRLRGVLSFGLLVPAPEGSRVGDDVAEQLGVTHYDPAAARSRPKGGLFTGGEVGPAPPVPVVKYDLEAGRRYAAKSFVTGESVIITEKCHGANGRYVYVDGQMYCGSRTEWKKAYPSYDHVTVESLVATGRVDEERARDIVARLAAKPVQRNMWWQAYDNTPAIKVFCTTNPGVVLYGEVYGAVQDLNYGHPKGAVSFAAFDVMRDGRFLDWAEARALAAAAGVPWVPIVAENVPFDFDRVCALAEGPSLVSDANHVREGVVVGLPVERRDDYAGRVKLKWVGCGYLERVADSGSPDDDPPDEDVDGTQTAVDV